MLLFSGISVCDMCGRVVARRIDVAHPTDGWRKAYLDIETTGLPSGEYTFCSDECEKEYRAKGKKRGNRRHKHGQ